MIVTKEQFDALVKVVSVSASVGASGTIYVAWGDYDAPSSDDEVIDTKTE